MSAGARALRVFGAGLLVFSVLIIWRLHGFFFIIHVDLQVDHALQFRRVGFVTYLSSDLCIVLGLLLPRKQSVCPGSLDHRRR